MYNLKDLDWFSECIINFHFNTKEMESNSMESLNCQQLIKECLRES